MFREGSTKILVADDDRFVRATLSDSLEQAGFHVLVARDGQDALDLLSPDLTVALLDLQMPRVGGLDCLRRIRERHPHIECIVITSSTDISDAVEAMKRGAFEYLVKPVNVDELIALVQRAVDSSQLRAENRQLREVIASPRLESFFVGESVAAQHVRSLVDKVADLDSTVMITGESGVGKGVVARMIHQGGPRRDGSLVTVNCTTLPRELVEAELFGHERGAFTGAFSKRLGKVELADGGSLFLDEVGDMPLELQPKLLAFLQDRQFQRIGGAKTLGTDARVIAATNQNLKERCRQKDYREDLYFRLNVLPIHIPPLRERRADIPLLAEHVLRRIAARRHCAEFEVPPASMAVLKGYSWPGNVRELENVLERVTAFHEGASIRSDNLFTEMDSAGSPAASDANALAGLTLAQIEKAALIQTLETSGGNKAEAARLLGISGKSIYNKMKRHGIR